MSEKLKLCPFCKSIEKKSSNAICSFGKGFPDDRPEGAISFCLRHSANGYELHAEAISIDDDGNECCEYDGNAEINFCPICGKPLNRRAGAESKPLTLEQLRKMDGEPVWCEIPQDNPQCGIVKTTHESVWLPTGVLQFKYYGEWKAYARKSKRE